jgi:hypothetical protein
LSFAEVEIKMRDRDGTGATFDTAYFVFHVHVAHTTPRIHRDVQFGESDGDLVVIDGFLD